ncbi:MAG: hypothetical protein IKE08_11210 [Clostridia bacterium]|nr:hypothetical protein [Clostridia bacterium]
MKSKKSKSPVFVVAILVSAAVGLYVVAGYFFGQAMKVAADVVYPMTNQHITWTYAGKDGAGK